MTPTNPTPSATAQDALHAAIMNIQAKRFLVGTVADSYLAGHRDARHAAAELVAAATAQAEHEAPGARKLAMLIETHAAGALKVQSGTAARELHWKFMKECIEKLVDLAAPASSAAQVAGPDGWVLVPREPTDDMYDAAVLAYRTWNEAEVRNSTFTHNDVWRAMLAAAPVTQVSKGERE